MIKAIDHGKYYILKSYICLHRPRKITAKSRKKNTVHLRKLLRKINKHKINISNNFVLFSSFNYVYSDDI